MHPRSSGWISSQIWASLIVCCLLMIVIRPDQFYRLFALSISFHCHTLEYFAYNYHQTVAFFRNFDMLATIFNLMISMKIGHILLKSMSPIFE